MVKVRCGTYDAVVAENNNRGVGDAMDGLVHLTAREADVLQLLARGCTYAQVGVTLGVSRHTVASHVKSAYLKLEVHSAAGAVMRAIQLRLIGIAGSWDGRHVAHRLRSPGRNNSRGKRR